MGIISISKWKLTAICAVGLALTSIGCSQGLSEAEVQRIADERSVAALSATQLVQRLDGLIAQLATLEQNVPSDLMGSISTIQQDVLKVRERLADTESELATARGDFTRDVSALQGSVSSLEGEFQSLGTLNEDIKSLDSRLTGIDITVKQLAKDVGSLGGVQELLEAREFALVDSGGNTRIALEFDLFGNPLVSLMDANGIARSQMGISRDSDNPGFWLYDRTGTVRAALSFDVDGRPGLELYDRNGEFRAQFRFDEGGWPALVFYDESGISRLLLGFDIGDEPIIRLFRPDGTIGTDLGFFDPHDPYIILQNANGSEPVRLEVLNGSGSLILSDDEDNVIATEQ